jgi:probable glucitol transport protein GutA
MAGKLREGFSVGTWEKTGYGLYFFGQNVFYGLIALNVQTFFSDVGITAATVGVILLVTKLWDAINDPIFGVIIDKVRFKKGRFLPWLRISLPFIAISSIAMFAMPISGTPLLKIIWAIISYVAWDMSYTICDVPIYVLPTTMTDNIKERTGVLAFGRYFAGIGIMGASMLLPAVQARLGWFMTALVFTIIGTVTMIPMLFSAKERHIVRSEKEITLKEMFHCVATNKFLLVFYIAMLVSSTTNFTQAVMIFFARYNLGNQALASILGLLTIVPTILLGAFIPALCRKFDKFHIFVFSSMAVAIINVITYFVGYSNLVAFFVLKVLASLIAVAQGMLLFMFTPDCIEYGAYHTGNRAEGSAVSIQTFFNKLTGSISGPIAMFILAAMGFVAGEGAAQPESAVTGIWLCVTIFPAIGGLASVFLLLRFYKLRDKDVQVMAQYNSGAIGKDEAENKLESRYGKAAALDRMTVSEG